MIVLDNFQMLYNLTKTQGMKAGPTSQVMVPPPYTTAHAPTTTPLSTTETTITSPGVEQLVNDEVMLTMEQTSP